jgi:hypothetical protein
MSIAFFLCAQGLLEYSKLCALYERHPDHQ